MCDLKLAFCDWGPLVSEGIGQNTSLVLVAGRRINNTERRNDRRFFFGGGGGAWDVFYLKNRMGNLG